MISWVGCRLQKRRMRERGSLEERGILMWGRKWVKVRDWQQQLLLIDWRWVGSDTTSCDQMMIPQIKVTSRKSHVTQVKKTANICKQTEMKSSRSSWWWWCWSWVCSWDVIKEVEDWLSSPLFSFHSLHLSGIPHSTTNVCTQVNTMCITAESRTHAPTSHSLLLLFDSVRNHGFQTHHEQSTFRCC